MKFSFIPLKGLFAILATFQAVCAESPSRPAFGLVALLESKYVTEGRDNLGDGGLLSVEAIAEWQGLVAGAWFATGESESYEELNLFVEYGLDLGPVGTYIGYTRLEFPEDDDSDNEITAGVEVNATRYLVPALDYTYSTQADGSFLEVSIRSEIVLLDGQLLLEPYVLEGFDFGYTSPEHDGPNNLQAGIDFAIKLSDPVTLVGSIAHSWAHEDVRNDGLGDLSWASIGVAAEL